jgi:hypothetical protein
MGIIGNRKSNESLSDEEAKQANALLDLVCSMHADSPMHAGQSCIKMYRSEAMTNPAKLLDRNMVDCRSGGRSSKTIA